MSRIWSSPTSEYFNYLTDADPIMQSIHRITYDELRTKLYTSIILDGNVLMAGSHILGSNLTSQLLFDEILLLEDGLVIPTLNTKYETSEDMVHARKQKYIKAKKIYRKTHSVYSLEEFLKSQFTSNHREKTIFNSMSLDGIINTKCGLIDDFARYIKSFDPREAVRHYTQSVIQELNSPKSTLRNKIATHSKKTLDLIVETFSQTEEIGGLWDRYWLLDILAGFPEHLKKEIVDFISFSYYLGGVRGGKDRSVIVAHEDLLPSINYKFRSTIVSSRFKEKIFEKFLDVFSISSKTIRQMSVEELVELNEDNTTKRFRSKLNKLLEIASNGLIDKKESRATELSLDIKHLENDLLEAITSKVEEKRIREYHKWRSFERGRLPIAVFAYVTKFLSFLKITSSPILSASTAGATVFGLVDPLINWLWKETGPCEFTVFINKYTHRIRQSNVRVSKK